MQIKKEETIAILVDIQERLAPAMHHSEKSVETASKLIQGLNILGVDIIPVQQYPKGLGDYVEPIKEALGEKEVYAKKSFSALGTPEIKDAIDAKKAKNVVVFGMEAHVCVLQTMLDLKAEGYNVVMVVDACDSRHKHDKKIAMKRAIQEDIFLTTYEALLFELLGGADQDHFKEISNLVK